MFINIKYYSYGVIIIIENYYRYSVCVPFEHIKRKLYVWNIENFSGILNMKIERKREVVSQFKSTIIEFENDLKRNLF